MAKITRREFCMNSAKWIALASVPGVLQLNPAKVFAGAVGTGGADEYMNLFGVDEEVLRKVMDAALSRGGNFCDLYFENTIANWVGLQDDAVNRAYSDVAFGVGIRVLRGDQTGFSYTEEISEKAMLKAAKTAARIANQGIGAQAAPLQYAASADYYPVDQLWENVSIESKIPFIQELNQKLHDKDSRIIKTRVWYGDQASRVMVVNSEGLLVTDYRPMAQVSASCTAEEGSKREECYYSIAARKGASHFNSKNMDEVAEEAVRRTVTLLEAVKPPAGEQEVVLADGSSGILLHEAIGHGMEADFNRKNESIFSDSIGKPVAENIVNIVDDGTWPGARGSLNFDDEGTPTQKTWLVRNGVLESYMHDLISAKHYGVAPTGNGRRESFRFMPVPRMRCTYMTGGPHKREEIIASVKKGVYCESFTNGQVNIGPGDFTFYVKTGYLIEDGKLTRPIKDANIIGNGPEVLRNVVMVGDDMRLATGGGMCGKAGQGVPVSMGLPTVKVSAITVGGVNS
jgi:TldD protein